MQLIAIYRGTQKTPRAEEALDAKIIQFPEKLQPMDSGLTPW